jgi:hypothetical protein
MAVVKAIVRGPEDFFDGIALRPQGSVVEVDEAFVSTADFIEVEVEVKLKQPIIDDNGTVHRFVKEKIRKRVMFRPLDGVEKSIDAAPAPAVVQPDRLNVSDLLKGGVQDIIAKIESGAVDDFLPFIADAETQGKGRKMIAEAVADRMAKA